MLPQLDHTTFISQLFWLVICFSVLYYFMSRVCLPRVRSIVVDRQDMIESSIESAESIKKRTEELNAEIAKLEDESAKKYQDAIGKATLQAGKIRDEGIAKLQKDLQNKVEKSNKDIGEFIDSSRNEAAKLSKKLAYEVLAKLIGKKA